MTIPAISPPESGSSEAVEGITTELAGMYLMVTFLSKRKAEGETL